MFRMRHIEVGNPGNEKWWKRYLVDLMLAFIVGLLLIYLILAHSLHLRVSTILLGYLFIVLYLAYTRGLRTAIIAAFIGCAAFDFLFVPPVFSISVYQVEDGWEMLIFLIFAIALSYSLSRLRTLVEKVKKQKAEESIRYEEQLRKQQEEVGRRNHQMSVFYEVMQATRDQKDLRSQLDLIAHTIEDVFGTSGIRRCAFFLPNAVDKNYSNMLAKSSSTIRSLTSNEEASLMWAMKHATSVVLSDVPLISYQKGDHLRRIVASNTTSDREIYRRNYLVPLISGRRVLGESGEKVLGVLNIVIDDIDHLELVSIKRSLESPAESPTTQTELFPNLIDHAVFLIEQALIERALMQQESLNKELQKRTEELHAAVISSVSHDFHSPLTLIKGAASSLLSQGLQSYDEVKYHHTLEAIVSEANWLERIVMRMLDLSRIEQGALKLEKELYPIEEIILYTLDLGHMRSLIQGREIHTLIPEDLPAVEVDPIFIGQVLVNLIENAIRYTPGESPIEISVQADKEFLFVMVEDSGPGFPPSELDHVFESFYRVHQRINGCVVTTANQGSGLGLAVCKGFVEAHEGRIWAENRDGGGARVQFTLPLQPAERTGYEKDSRG